jgi:hypothetical protein
MANCRILEIKATSAESGRTASVPCETDRAGDGAIVGNRKADQGVGDTKEGLWELWTKEGLAGSMINVKL